MQPCSLLTLRHRQVVGSLTLTLLLLRGGADASGSGPQCSRSAGPAPARSALQAGRNRARIPSACPPARSLARPPFRPRPLSQVSAPGSVPHAPRALGQRARRSLPWRPSGALRRLERPRSLLLLPSTPVGCLEPPTLCWSVGWLLRLAGEGAAKKLVRVLEKDSQT